MGTDWPDQTDWILLPGTLCTDAVFAPFLDYLGVGQNRRKPVAIDRPAVSEYRDELASSARGAVVCGFSLGAIIAAHLADQLDAHRIILFALNPFPDDPAKATARHDLSSDVAARGGASALAPRLPPLSGPKPGQAHKTILDMANMSASYIAAQTQLALTRPNALAALSRTQAPVMVLTGTEDLMAPMAQGQAASDAAPNGRFASLQGLGHYALLEDPELCAQSLLELEAARP